jgi:hypothetical protein
MTNQTPDLGRVIETDAQPCPYVVPTSLHEAPQRHDWIAAHQHLDGGRVLAWLDDARAADGGQSWHHHKPEGRV